jgi:hypothetical protein
MRDRLYDILCPQFGQYRNSEETGRPHWGQAWGDLNSRELTWAWPVSSKTPPHRLHSRKVSPRLMGIKGMKKRLI